MPLDQQSPIDQAARTQALDPSASFAVSAPAGSGKTGLLTQRVLALLATCEEPENLLAITFTKKAAAEMQSRILEALYDTQAAEHEPEEDYQKTTWQLARAVLQRNEEKQWQLFSCPNRLRITTIDSFCRSLSQQMPFESGLGSTPDILDNPNTAYEMAARETIALLDKTNEYQEDIQRLVKHCNNQLDQVEALFCKLLSKRDQWLSLLYGVPHQREALEQVLNTLIEEHLHATRKALAPIASDLAMLADHAASHLQDTQSPIKHCLGLTDLPAANIESIKQWHGLAALMLTGKNIRKSPTATIGFIAPSAKGLSPEQKAQAKADKDKMSAMYELCRHTPALHDATTQLLFATNSLPDNRYPDAQWELLDSLTRLLLILTAHLKLAFQQLGKTDYLQVTLAALDALGDADSPTDLALALDYRIQHILIDEFQDTSTTQLHLLQRLTAGWQNDDGRTTLFVVGDAMQSCYRFRDANVGIFLNVREHGLGDIHLEALDLTVNFRSQKAIVDWVNQSFSAIFPEEDDINRGSVSYQSSHSVKPDLGIHSVNTHLLSYTDSKPTRRQEEAAVALRLVQETQQQRPNDSIAILVRSKKHSQEIIQALAQAGIAYQATDIDRLDTCMPVLDILSLTRALLYPNDRIAWLSILRAPWCGLNMQDLLTISQYNKHADQPHKQPLLIQTLNNPDAIAQLSTEGQASISRLMSVIQPAIGQQKRLPLRRWIQGVWLTLGGPSLLLNPDDATNITTFFELLEKYEQGGTISAWEDLEKAVNELYAKPAKTGDSAQTHNSDAIPAVEIMTIHKSKGLEFDTVILPALDKKAGMDDKELMVWLERIGYSHQHHRQEQQLLISPVHAVGDDKDLLYGFIKQQLKDKETIEADRLLYVACTRAIKQLHLIGYAAQDSKADSTEAGHKEPGKDTALSRLWPCLWTDTSQYPCHIIPVEDSTDSNNGTEQGPLYHPNHIAKLSNNIPIHRLQANELLSAYRGNNALASISANDNENDEGNNNIAKPDALLQRQQRYIGTVIHKALEHITKTGYQQWDATRIQRQQVIWRSQLIQQGINQQQIHDALNTVTQAIERTLNDTKGQWILDNAHEQSATELALWDRHGQHIIDRTFIAETIDTNSESNNSKKTRWIIDYKSSQPNEGETLETFTQYQVQEYQPQLARYKKLFVPEKHTVRTALYFPLLTLWVEV